MIFVVSWLDKTYWRFSKAILDISKLVMLGATVGNPQTIVVLRNCFFGDFVVSIPALEKLRRTYPSAHIVFLTATSFATAWRDRMQDSTVFDIAPGLIDKVICYSARDFRSQVDRAALRERVRAACKGATVTLALCYSADGLLSRIKRIMFCVLLNLPFPLGLTATPTLPKQGTFNRWRVGRTDILHQYQAAIASVNELTNYLGSSLAFPMPNMYARSVVRSRKPATTLIGVAPFTKQRVKQWPLHRFAEMMTRLSRETGANFEIYGAPEECHMVTQLVSLLHESVKFVSFCGTLTPSQLRQRVENVDLLVCLDSGPMHLASLVETPVVAIFSQITLHQFWRPWGSKGLVVSCDVPCVKCDTRNGVCPLGSYACIDGVSVEDVLKHVHTCLKLDVQENIA